MGSVTLVERPQNKREFYLYYNEWTGEILSVGCQERPEERAPFLVTEAAEAGKMLEGVLDERQYLVTENEEHELALLPKSETIRLRARQDSLYQFSKTGLTEWDIRARVYKLNNKMSLEVNQASVSRLGNFKIRREIRVEGEDDIPLYLVKRNSPDWLLAKIDVDIAQLLQDHAIVYDIEHIADKIDLDDLSILTKRLFKNYQLETVDDNYVFSTSGNAGVQNDQIIRAQDQEYGHIQIEQDGNQIIFTSQVETDQFDSIGLFQRSFRYYVVGSQPDQFIDTIDVDLTQLRMGRPERFQVEYNIDDVEFVYRNPRLVTIKRKSH
jgi:hypothetical protein